MSNGKSVKINAGALESILFAHGESVSFKKLCGLLDISKNELEKLAASLKQTLTDRNSGLMLLEIGDDLALVTSPAHGHILEKLIKKEFSEELTPAAQETLAIVAYAGPIPRVEIEYIRGVNSSFTIRSLLIRGLVERVADPKRASGYLYSLSFNALKHLGLSKVEELPEYARFRTLTDEFRGSVNNKDGPLL